MAAEKKPILKHEYELQAKLTGHNRSISSVKFSPECQWLASASGDKTIRIWSAGDGKHETCLQGHFQGVSDVAWASDSRYLATASDDNTLKLWDIEAGEALQTLLGHSHYVFCVSFNPQGNLVASGSFDETVRIWDVKAGKCIKTLPAHSDPVTSVVFNAGGDQLVSSSFDGLIRIWDVSTGNCVGTLAPTEENPPAVSYVQYSHRGKYIVASTLDSCIRLWRTSDRKIMRTYKGHTNTKFCCFACSPRTSQRLLSGSEDGKVFMWGMNGAERLLELQANDSEEGPVIALDASKDCEKIATGASPGTLKLWKRQPDPVPMEE